MPDNKFSALGAPLRGTHNRVAWSVLGRSPRRGDAISAVEAAFAALQFPGQGPMHVIACANGSVALSGALRVLGVGAFDLVYVPGLTWQATAAACLDENAVPILVDSEVDRPTLDLVWVERDLQARAARGEMLPRAMIIVDLYQWTVNRAEAVDLCDRWGMDLIEDCAHSVGASWAGVGVGSFGRFGSTSVQSSKVLPATERPSDEPGEGGFLTTADDHLAVEAATWVSCGRRPDGADVGWVPVQAGNNRITTGSARILLHQAKEFPARHAMRLATAAKLNQLAIRGLAAVPETDPRARGVMYKYARVYDASAFGGLPVATFRAALQHKLGYEVAAPYQPLDASPVYTPNSIARGRISAEYQAATDPVQFALPNAHRWAEELVLLEHAFLCDLNAADLLDAAVEAVRSHAAEL